jgi:hypothetical protein
MTASIEGLYVGSTTFKIFGEIPPDRFEQVRELASLIGAECGKFLKLDPRTRSHVAKEASDYLKRIHWLPLLVTCDEVNNLVSYKVERRIAPRTLNIDIMFEYNCHLSISYSQRADIHKSN